VTLVHIIGTKYTDYFTDGTNVTTFPGDPKIDSNLDKPNAPIPAHEGLKWDHTDGTYLYDTASGDLEVGEYAVQADGSYIENTSPFVSSTSSPAQMDETASTHIVQSSTSSSERPQVNIPDALTSWTLVGHPRRAGQQGSLDRRVKRRPPLRAAGLFQIAFSLRITSQPTALSASIWTVRSWSVVLTRSARPSGQRHFCRALPQAQRNAGGAFRGGPPLGGSATIIQAANTYSA
jgi:hypothetical protein